MVQNCHFKLFWKKWQNENQPVAGKVPETPVTMSEESPCVGGENKNLRWDHFCQVFIDQLFF